MSKLEDNLLIDLKHSADFDKDARGDIIEVSGRENLYQALFHRLMTTQGSLAHQPEYGVGIKSWQNQLGSLDNQRRLALKIKEQFELDDRVEEVSGVSVKQSADNPGSFTVLVSCTAVGYNESTEEFNISEVTI